MKRARWGVALAGVLLTTAGGCSLADVKGFLWVNPELEKVGEYYATQTVDEAALMVEVALNRMGLKATSTPQGNGVVLASATSKGNKFRVFISSDTEGRTRMRVEWLDAPDRDVQALVIGGLQATLVPAQKK